MEKKRAGKVCAVLFSIALGIGILGNATVTAKAETTSTTETITLEPLTLKTGEVWEVSNRNIDPMIEKTGYGDIPEGQMLVYWPGHDLYKSVFDTNYLVAVLGYELLEEGTLKSLYAGYATEEEMRPIYDQYAAGTLEYNGVKATFVESGSPYFVRAEKVGTTTLTIPTYQMGADAAPVEIILPIVIEEAEAPEPTPGPDNAVINSSDGNTAINNETGIIPSGTTMTTAKIESGAQYDDAKSLTTKLANIGKYAFYDLSLYDVSNAEIHQLSGKVQVIMTLPFAVGENNTLKVYRVDNDKLVECVSRVDNGKVIFETDHFSTYVFAEQGNAGEASPKTGDSISVYGTFVLFLISGLALCVCAVSLNRKKKSL